MKFTTLTVHRGTGPINSQTVVASGIVTQIDQQSLDMQQFDHGAAPYDLFMVYAWTDQIARNDHLVDADGLIYTVSARPETFFDGHMECTATMPVGS
jgi:hypothetical protein